MGVELASMGRIKRPSADRRSGAIQRTVAQRVLEGDHPRGKLNAACLLAISHPLTT